jgi:hypothetical protein
MGLAILIVFILLVATTETRKKRKRTTKLLKLTWKQAKKWELVPKGKKRFKCKTCGRKYASPIRHRCRVKFTQHNARNMQNRQNRNAGRKP